MTRPDPQSDLVKDNAATAPEPAAVLRQRAEARWLKKSGKSADVFDDLTIQATQDMLHELQVHQIEMEMQNEELRRTQIEVEASKARYVDLYDLAPVGYCTVSEAGLILQANLTLATLLGVARGALVKKPLSRFIRKEDQNIYYRLRNRLSACPAADAQAGEPNACELRMVQGDV